MRVYRCDECNGIIEWKEGQKGGDPPPITVRGQGLVLDFCSAACMGEWGVNRDIRERALKLAQNTKSLKQRQAATKETVDAEKEDS